MKPRIQLKYLGDNATLVCECSTEPVWHFPRKAEKKYDIIEAYNSNSETILIQKLNILHNGFYICQDNNGVSSAEIYVGGEFTCV